MDSLSVTPDDEEWKEWVEEERFFELDEREEGRFERWRAMSEEGKEVVVEVEGEEGDDDDAVEETDFLPLDLGSDSDPSPHTPPIPGVVLVAHA